MSWPFVFPVFPDFKNLRIVNHSQLHESIVYIVHYETSRSMRLMAYSNVLSWCESVVLKQKLQSTLYEENFFQHFWSWENIVRKSHGIIYLHVFWLNWINYLMITLFIHHFLDHWELLSLPHISDIFLQLAIWVICFERLPKPEWEFVASEHWAVHTAYVNSWQRSASKTKYDARAFVQICMTPIFYLSRTGCNLCRLSMCWARHRLYYTTKKWEKKHCMSEWVWDRAPTAARIMKDLLICDVDSIFSAAVSRHHLLFGSFVWIRFQLAKIQSVDCIYLCCLVWKTVGRWKFHHEMIENENDSMNAISVNPLISSSLMPRHHLLKIAQKMRANIASKHSWKHNLCCPDVDKVPYLVFVRILTKLYLFLWNNSNAHMKNIQSVHSERAIILYLWGSYSYSS